ncbi:hypothetical protein OMAG_000775 [Candidatus Omnitrophus magneticus]|uniref:Uncharacterized protein n=1 Tax=Candidatus Omnitrophus magneticus TaxID=1609969 RepID=A0A0F0CTJ5_9BACT|nr:hypothetical protein OMAG_000775 [Candidatus Omnitrophus magneticus]
MDSCLRRNDGMENENDWDNYQALSEYCKFALEKTQGILLT